MIVIAIIGVLAAIGTVQYVNMMARSGDALTKGNLGTIRSALSIYYSDNEGNYPTDNLASMANSARYLQIIPITRLLPHHPDITLVTPESTLTETGGWSYNNDANSADVWGKIHVGCLHQDSRAQTWSQH